DAAGFAVPPDDDGARARPARLSWHRQDLAHTHAVVYGRPRAGFWRPGVSGPDPFARRRQERSSQRDRLQFDPDLYRARSGAARLRRHDYGVAQVGLAPG